MTTFASLKDQVESLYVGYFGRTDDGSGASYWVNQIESGAMTLAKVAESFAVQPEALAKYSYLSAPSTGSPTDFVSQVYHQLFNHDADAAGLAYWTAQLTAASGSPQAISQFIGNVISGATGADDTAMKNKVDVPQVVTPKAPDVAPPPTVPVAPQAPTESVTTNDTAPPVIGGTTLPVASGTATVTAGVVSSAGFTWLSSGADQLVNYGGVTIVKVTTSTDTSSYFFTMYDVTNSRTVIADADDTVALIGSVEMSAADYTNIINNHFMVVAA